MVLNALVFFFTRIPTAAIAVGIRHPVAQIDRLEQRKELRAGEGDAELLLSFRLYFGHSFIYNVFIRSKTSCVGIPNGVSLKQEAFL